MAQIDLKFATVKFIDGFAGAATVPTTAPAAAATTLTITGYVGSLAIGDEFFLAGETVQVLHTVTAHTETGGNTTSVTFTPALGAGTYAIGAALSFQPHEIEATLGEGNLEYTEKRNIEYKLNKGKIKFVRLGDEVPMDASLNFVWEFLTSAAGDLTPTIEDALKQRSLASGWVSTGLDPCEPYCLDIQVVYTPPCSGVQKETITLKYFRYEELQHNF